MAAFRHEHRVAEGEGGTLYTDRVTYAAIGGTGNAADFRDAASHYVAITELTQIL